MPNTRRTVLVVDDDRLFCRALEAEMSSAATEVISAFTGAAGVALCAQRPVDVVLLDQNLPDGRGVDLCEAMLKHNERTKIVLITAQPHYDNVVEAIRHGAFDYLSKPFEMAELEMTLERAFRTRQLESIEQLSAFQAEQDDAETVLVGASPAINEVRQLIHMAAAVNSTVLITGETGTGKNLVAKQIHRRAFASAPFVRLNCGALPEPLIEAELFGYEKGAFTGAATARRGVFELAEGGSLFLDEIATMRLHLQASLLGILDDKIVKRLGSETQRPVSVRIIAATNADLEDATRAKTFRADLYHRLNVMRIHVPPLREHKEDIPDLCRHFIALLSPTVRTGRSLELPESELAKLGQYDWPGNARELRNVIERAVILERDGILRPSALLGGIAPVAYAAVEAARPGSQLLPLDQIEARYIRDVLDATTYNVTRAAQTLGISPSTLRRKMRQYKLPSPRA